MKSLVQCVSLLIAVFLGFSWQSSAVSQQKNDLEYITGKAAGILIVHPRKILTDPDLELMPIEVISAATLREIGVDLLDVEKLTLLVEPPEGPGPPQVGMIARFAKPYDLTTFSPKLMKNCEEGRIGDKTVFRATSPMAPSFYLPNEKTVVAGMEPILTRMMGEPKEGTLRKLIAKNGAKEHLNLIVSIDEVRELLNAAIKEAGDVPQPFRRFIKAIDDVSFVEYRMSLGSEVSSSLTFNTHNEESARKVEDVIQEGLELGKSMFLEKLNEEFANSEDEIEQATSKYMNRISRIIFDSLKPQRDGKKVAVSVKGGADMATIGVLTALLLPAVQAAREAARRAHSSNNMKQIGLAFHNHFAAKRKFPSKAIYSDAGKPLLSWRVQILPYLEQQNLYDQFHLDEPWDSEHNKALISKMPGVFRNPNGRVQFKTNYLLPVGPGTIFEKNESLGMRDITDGTSNTIMLVEANDDQAVIWTRPSDLDFDPDRPLSNLGKVRAGIFLALVADGSVNPISTAIDPAILKAMFSAAGGEKIRF